MVQFPTQSLLPFFASERPNDPPRLFGTGVLFEAGQRFFLLSAAHVFDQAGDDMTLPAGLVSPGPTQRIVTEVPEGGRAADKLDVGFTELHRLLAEQLVNKMGRRFLTPADVNPDDRMQPGKKYSFIGYPASHSRVSVSAERLAAKPLEFALSPIAPDKLRATGWAPEVNLGGAFVRNSMQNQNGVRVNAPEPLGISGGGVWTKDAAGGYTLVGIGIEWDGRNEMLIGTRIGFLTAMLAGCFPEIAPHLPQCSYLRPTIERSD